MLIVEKLHELKYTSFKIIMSSCPSGAGSGSEIT